MAKTHGKHARPAPERQPMSDELFLALLTPALVIAFFAGFYIGS